MEMLNKVIDTVVYPIGLKIFNSRSLIRHRLKKEFRKPIGQFRFITLRDKPGYIAFSDIFKLTRSNSYIKREELENGIRDAILDDNCGVHVFWAPANFGKSFTVRRVTSNLQENNIISGNLCVTCDDSWREYKSLQKWLYSKLPLPDNQFIKPLGDFIDQNQRILLIIDQFDKLMASSSCSDFVTSLAEDSVMRKTYSVMILVTSDSHYNEILDWNGRQKIRPCFSISDTIKLKWKREEFEELLEKTTTEQQRKNKDYNRYIDAWLLASTPGFALQTRFMKDIDAIENEAKRLSQLWPKTE